jgi:hypothetical protein
MIHQLTTKSGNKTKHALKRGYIQVPKKSKPNNFLFLTWESDKFCIQGVKDGKKYQKYLATKSISVARDWLEIAANSSLPV